MYGLPLPGLGDLYQSGAADYYENWEDDPEEENIPEDEQE